MKSIQQDADDDLRLRFELAGAYQRIALVLGYPQAANLGDRAGAIDGPGAGPPADRGAGASIRRPRRHDRSLHPDRASSSRPCTGWSAGRPTPRRQARQRCDAPNSCTPASRTSGAGASCWPTRSSRWPGEPRTHQASLPIWKRAASAVRRAAGRAAGRPQRDAERRPGGEIPGRPARAAEAIRPPRSATTSARSSSTSGVWRGRRTIRRRALDTAIDLSNVAVAYERLKDFERGVVLRTRSVEMRRALAQADPQNDLLRGRLAHALASLARVEATSRRFDAAVRHAAEAVTLARTVGVRRRAGQRASHRAGGGAREPRVRRRAAVAARRLLPLVPRGGRALHPGERHGDERPGRDPHGAAACGG